MPVADFDEKIYAIARRVAGHTSQIAAFAVSAASVHEIIAAPGAGKKIVIHGYCYIAAANVYLDLRDGTDPLIDDQLANADVQYSSPAASFPLSENSAFNLQLTAVSYTTGFAIYSIEDV